MTGNTQTDWVARVLFDAAAIQGFHIISCDSASSFRLGEFAAAYPDRLHEVGAAEQASLAIAFGLARETRRVVVVGFSSFLLFRGFEVLRSLIAYHRANVLIVGGMAGLSHGRDGYMHQSVEDIGLVKLLPEFRILTPSDKESVFKSMVSGLELKVPTYIRITRRPVEFAVPILRVCSGSELYRVLVRSGRRAAVVTYGMLVPIAIEAVEELQAMGLGITVVEIIQQRPFPEGLAVELAEAELIVTFEDHRLSGGLSQDLHSVGFTRCMPLAIPDNALLRSGTTEELLVHHNLTRQHLVSAIVSRLGV